jgi:hypothetical protein
MSKRYLIVEPGSVVIGVGYVAAVASLVALAYSYWSDRSQNGLMVFSIIGSVLVVISIIVSGVSIYLSSRGYYNRLCRGWEQVL